MTRELKKHLSIDGQLEKLENRGLRVESAENARTFLSNVNYYRLSGYLHEFRKPHSDYYEEGTTFERIAKLYEFDTKLTRILMYALENVEVSLKTRFSYMLSSKYPEDPCIYLDKNIYRDDKQFSRFVGYFEASKKSNEELPFIKHHNKNYGGQLPIWVAVEILTMGNMHALYNNLIGAHQKELAKEYNTGPNQLSSWLENITYTRNHLAHYMRIYDYKFGRTPKSCNNHKSFTSTGRIFDQIVIIGYLFSDKNEWNKYVITEIDRIINFYKDYIELADIGFPKDWKEQLTMC